jgi:hypothetical protein
MYRFRGVFFKPQMQLKIVRYGIVSFYNNSRVEVLIYNKQSHQKKVLPKVQNHGFLKTKDG